MGLLHIVRAYQVCENGKPSQQFLLPIVLFHFDPYREISKEYSTSGGQGGNTTFYLSAR